MRRTDAYELLEQPTVLGQRDERVADMELEVDPEDGAGSTIRRANTEVRFERDNSGAQSCQDDLELAALAFELLFRRARLPT
jgi:hypothetical protein